MSLWGTPEGRSWESKKRAPATEWGVSSLKISKGSYLRKGALDGEKGNKRPPVREADVLLIKAFWMRDMESRKAAKKKGRTLFSIRMKGTWQTFGGE